jgi:hypothetical protein
VPDSPLPLEDSEPPVAPEPPLELSEPVPEPEPPVPDDDSDPLELSLPVPPEEDPSLSFELSLLALSPSLVLVEGALVLGAVAVVAVVLVRVASLSAVVLLGGVISGVLCGTASETLLPPHAPSAAPQTKTSSSPHNPARTREGMRASTPLPSTGAAG